MALARNIATVGGATLISRVLGFLRDAGIAALFGSTPAATAFFAVLQFVNFFRRLLAEGAVNGAFAPIWLRLDREHGAHAANRFTRRALFVTGLFTVALGFAAFLFAPLAVKLIAPGFDSKLSELAYVYFILAVPYVTLAGLVAVLGAALNAEGRVGAVAIGTIAFNAVMLIALLAIVFTGASTADQLNLSGAVMAAAVVIAGLVQLLVVAAAWLWRGARFGRAPPRIDSELRRFFRRALPALISAGIPQLKLLAGAAIASSTAVGVSWLYYANRLYELPLGVASVAIATVIIPRIAASLRAGAAQATHAQSRAFEIALGLALPAAAGFALLAEPIAAGLFERGAFSAADSTAVAAALAAICGGLPGHVLEKVLAAISFGHEDTRTPLLAALVGLAVAIVIALLLQPRYGHVGVAGAIAISGWAGAAMLGAALARRKWLRLDAAALRRLPLLVLATALMAAAVAAGRLALWPYATSAASRLALLALLVALGVTVYLALLQMLRIARLSQIAAAVRSRAER